MNVVTVLLTENPCVGVTPPPPETAPGCGAPWGGNMFKGGGEMVATAATGAAGVSVKTCVTTGGMMGASVVAAWW